MTIFIDTNGEMDFADNERLRFVMHFLKLGSDPDVLEIRNNRFVREDAETSFQEIWLPCATAKQKEIDKLKEELEKAKAQAVPETQAPSITLTCADLKEAFDFGAPDGEKDQFQMETEMTIKWLDDGYDGAGYYCWYADLPEEGCIKLGESESGAEG
ncbi:hypothetical protein [Acinetobacter baumannii]|uniref:hypothetical protein n=1 Tax=Acinetobacter baumannii TaxID=470 RepID=UPI00044DD2BA|nr:hypothetical protein J669_1820 [Acinetobacter baumannii 1295549]EXR93373.1 hypothetical protein J680_0454 [Acinetobacter baumannii 277047]EXS39875.1 hypothetical protein J677_0635 [Acinetobacter baumannii 426863]